jgi:hypothetical protein
MTQVTSDQLRDISIRCTEQFLNNKVPLSQALAKEASAHNLNSDQIKRAVEATNTVAFLKVASLSPDKTIEFPLCKYSEVLQGVSLPAFEKSASDNLFAADTAVKSAIDEAELFANSVMEKAASEMNTLLGTGDLKRALIKEAAMNRAALEALKPEADLVAENLVKAAKLLSQDDRWLDKLAHVVQGYDHEVLSTLVSGTPVQARDFGGHAIIKEADLKVAKTVSALYKQAQELARELRTREGLQKKADEQIAGLTKEALLTGLGAKAGRSIGTGLGKATSSFTTGPAKSIGVGIKNTVSKIGAKKGAIMGAVGAGATTAMDSAMFSPGIDRGTGRSKDVWSSLHG